MARSLRVSAAGIIAAVLFFGGSHRAQAQGHPAFTEPVTLASSHGVLEVELTSHQSETHLDTVSGPVKNVLLYAYRVIRGSASDGKMQDDGLYPAPTLQVFPGETLVVHMNNALGGLTIRDYYNPAYTPKGKTIPIYPEQLASSPINLHVHGLHVTPRGNGDNVLLDIPAGMSNTYTYHIPKDMPQGAYWYHSHLHTLTTPQTYFGLAGILSIGRLDGNLPIVTQRHIPIRNMVLQYNAVFDRGGGLAQFNNLNWPQFVSTLTPPTGSQLADGTYAPSLAPVNFLDSKAGTKYFTVWYAGKLSIENMRGLFQFMPSNLQTFTGSSGKPEDTVAADPSQPDAQRDVQFTVNGQFQPEIKSKAGQTEIWVLENVSDMAYINVELTETATGHHPQIAIVGQDGNPYPEVHYPPTMRGRELLIPPASRFAIAVTMPQKGDLVLEMPPMGRGAKAKSAPGILYTHNGSGKAPAVLGNITVLPSAMSYADGFFIYPTQILARAVPSEGTGRSTAFVEGQKLHAYTSFVDVSREKPDVERTLVIGGGFLNNLANPNDPKAFMYSFDGNTFPYIPLIQPRLGSVEEWTFINHNNDEHPIHVHVNDFQVMRSHDPTTGLTTGVEMWGDDNVNVPAPTMGAQEAVVTPGSLTMRTKFLDFTGLYVLHCHRLNHEDNGLMAAINVIPAVSSYAVAVAGTAARAAQVKVYDGSGDRLIATVTPFPDFHGTPNVAMGDIEGDGVLDLVVATGSGTRPRIVVYSGRPNHGRGAFESKIADFAPFSADQRGGVSVAAAQIDGSEADNIIVGSGAGAPDRVNVYSSQLPAPGSAPAVFTGFDPYPNDRSGVNVAAGVVDLMAGRYSIVTAPGAGAPALVKVFRIWLLSTFAGAPIDPMIKTHTGPREAVVTASFMPFGASYRGGTSLAVGWLAGSYGGAQSIVAGQMNGSDVKVYSSGTGMMGAPAIYLKDPQMHDYEVGFAPIATLQPFGNVRGVRVGTTATTEGADLLVSGERTNGNMEVLKFRFTRATPTAHWMKARRLDLVTSIHSFEPAPLAGN